MSRSSVSQASGKTYETHFELALRLGEKPEAVAERILAGEFPDFGFSGGVYYLPLGQGPAANAFFEKLMAVRYGLA